MPEALSPQRLVPKITEIPTRLGHSRTLPPGLSSILPFPARRHSGLPAPRPAAREGRSWPPLLCTTRGLSLVNAQPSRKTQEGKHEVTPSWQSRATHAPLRPLLQLWERPRRQAGASSPLLLLHKPRWARLRALGGHRRRPLGRALCPNGAPTHDSRTPAVPSAAAPLGTRPLRQQRWGALNSGSFSHPAAVPAA